MTKYALLFDNKYCTGCHSCEIACKNEHGLSLGQWGIKLLELGPWKLPDDVHWEFKYVPMLSTQCDLCSSRTKDGLPPACVQHCLAEAIEYGTLEELTQIMNECGEMCSIVLP